MKWFLRGIIIFFISILLASLKITFNGEYFNVMYTVLGIMFSVGISQVLNFSFSEITNNDFVIHQRAQLNNILIVFVILFTIATLSFIFQDIRLEYKFKIFKFSSNALFGAFFIFCLIYYIRNFFSLLNLKNEIEDLLRKAKKIDPV